MRLLEQGTANETRDSSADLCTLSFRSLPQTSLAFARSWHLVDAKDRVLGKLAVGIATTLMGKHKPIYDQSIDAGDYVVVTNANQVVVTGRKSEQVVYRHHSMYPGGLKEIDYKRMMEKKPEEVSLAASNSDSCEELFNEVAEPAAETFWHTVAWPLLSPSPVVCALELSKARPNS